MTAYPTQVLEQLQAMALEKAKRLRAEAVLALTDLVAPRPLGFPSHSSRKRAQPLPAKFPRALASRPAEPQVEWMLVEQALVALVSLRIAAAPLLRNLRSRRKEPCAVFLFSPSPYAERVTLGPRLWPGVAASEGRPAEPR